MRLYSVFHKLFHKTMQKLSAKFSKRGATASPKKEGLEATALFASANIRYPPWYFVWSYFWKWLHIQKWT